MQLTFPERVVLQSLARYSGKITFVLRDTRIPESLFFTIVKRLQEKNLLGPININSTQVAMLPLDQGEWRKISELNPFSLHQILDQTFFEQYSIDTPYLNDEQLKELEILLGQVKNFIAKVRSQRFYEVAPYTRKKLVIFGQIDWNLILQNTWDLLKK